MRIVQATADDREMNVWEQLPDGRIQHHRHAPEFSFFLRKKDVTEELRRFLTRSSLLTAHREEGDFIRFSWKEDAARKLLIYGRRGVESPLKEVGVEIFEGDVRPVRRFLVDKDCEIARPRRCYVDIETDSRVPFSRKEEARILSIVAKDDVGGRHRFLLPEDSNRAEADMLAQYWEALGAYDQVLAWNGDRFDFPVLKARTEGNRVRVQMARWLQLDHLALFKRMNTAAESGDEKQSMALQAIAMQFLGEGKDDFDASKTWEAWEAGGESRARMLEYNEKDVDLLVKLEAKTGFCDLFQAIAEVCRVLPDSIGLLPTQQMDGFMLRLGAQRGLRFRTKIRREEGDEETFEGAFVLEPKEKGIIKNVHVCDFAGMYPSIMLSWNMSPETRLKMGAGKGQKVAQAPVTRECFDVEGEGILTVALRQLISMRKEWTSKKTKEPPGTPAWKDADRKSTAYKVVANSFYGVVGSQSSRFYDSSVAESVTTTGRWLIQRTIQEAAKRGMIAIYGDTDSLFVRGCSREEFREFVAWTNEELYPKLAQEQGCVENHIKLEYEKEFERLIFAGAKKRYCGSYAHFKGAEATADSKPEIKGLEYKRGDSVVLARRFQGRIIDILCKQKEERPSVFREVVEQVKSRVLQGNLERFEYVISKSVSKPLNEYVQKKKLDGSPAAQPPHIVIAKQLKADGHEVHEGTKIEYVVVDGEDGIKAVSAIGYEGDFDRYYLWENLVYPPTQRLLEGAFPDYDWTVGLASVRPKFSKRGKPLKGQALLLGSEEYVVEVDAFEMGRGVIEQIRTLATKHPGQVRLVIQLTTETGERIRTETPYGVLPNVKFRDDLRGLVASAAEYRFFEEAYKGCVSS